MSTGARAALVLCALVALAGALALAAELRQDRCAEAIWTLESHAFGVGRRTRFAAHVPALEKRLGHARFEAESGLWPRSPVRVVALFGGGTEARFDVAGEDVTPLDDGARALAALLATGLDDAPGARREE